MLEYVLIGLTILGVIVLGLIRLVASRPTDFKIERSESIAAAPMAVFAKINDLHEWEHWSPWAKLDPAMKSTYEGPASGEGSIYGWSSANNKVGEGRMTLTKSRPPESIGIQLDFIRPMACTNQVEFTLRPESQGTAVTWAMTGKNGFVAKAFHLMMNIDKLVGGDFAKGLAQLKSLVESTGK